MTSIIGYVLQRKMLLSIAMQKEATLPRNYEKEMQWRKSKYRQVGFMAEIHVAEMFKRHLAEHGIKPIDWFRHAVSMSLVPALAGANDAEDGAAENAAGDDAADGGAKGGASGVSPHAGANEAEGGGVGAPDNAAGDDAADVGAKCGAPGVPPARRKRMPGPAPELVAEWAALRAGGMPYARIAMESGYERSTVRKRVAAHGRACAARPDGL